MNYLTYVFVLLITMYSTLHAFVQGDVNKDNKINSTEAIYALQVTAGFKQQLTMNEIDGHSLNAADGNPVDIIYVDDEGKVGIGTVNPISSLTVKGSINFSKELSGLVIIQKDSNRVFGSGTQFLTELKNGDSIFLEGDIYTIQDLIDNEQLIVSTTAKQTIVDKKIYVENDLLQVQNSKSESKLIFDKNGNLGIGTNPGSKLDVNGFLMRKIHRRGQLGPNFSYDQYDPVKITDRTLQFTKIKDNTSVKIEFTDYIGTDKHCAVCTWEIRVDDLSCTEPLIFLNYACIDTKYNSPMTIQTLKGYCEGIEAGNHEIQIWLHKSSNYSHTPTKCVTGSNGSRWTIDAEEVY